MFKDLSKKFVAWFTKETIGNFLYDLLGIAWKSAVVSAFISLFLKLFRSIPFDAWFFLAVFTVLAGILALERYARRRGWVAFPVHEPERQKQPPDSQSGAVTLQVHDSLHGCPEERLHQWKENDRHSVWRLIKPFIVSCDLHVAQGGPPPFVVFRFGVFSLTLVEVSLNEKVEGTIVYTVPEHEPLTLRRGKSIEENEAKQILFRGRYTFKVRQDLTWEEADYIRDTQGTGFFKMDDLAIRVLGADIDEQRLDTRFSVKTTENYMPDLIKFLD